MPIYEYRRPDGSTFEIVQSFSDDSLTHDPETGVEVQRVLHAPAVHFKGKGFYNTDYGTRKRQRENAAASSSEGSSSAESSSPDGDSGTAGEKGSKDGGSAKGSASEGKSAEGGSKSDKGASGSKKSEAVAAKS
jgi:putative FmdB family regulatory protein